MKFWFLAIVGLIGIILLSGCTDSRKTYSGDSGSAQTTTQDDAQAETAPENEVQAVSIVLALAKNWDADAEADGVEITFKTEDKDGSLVKAEGVINAKLYSTVTDYETFSKIKSNLIKEWAGVEIKEDSYGWMGADVRLEYGGVELPEDRYATGWLELTFITKDGKEFNTQDDSVFLKEL